MSTLTPTHQTAILLFARSPRRERKAVGLRLRAGQRLHEALLQRTLCVLRGAEAMGADLVISCDDAALAREAGCPRWLLQRGDSFEARLLDALRRTAALGYRRVVLVGADIPTLSPRDLARSLQQGAQEATLGPSPDGGFYLLGMDLAHVDALCGLPWGQRDLCARLRAALRARGLTARLLPMRRDIDTARDLRLERGLLEDLSRQYLCAELFPSPPAEDLDRHPPRALSDQQQHTLRWAARPPPALIAA
jgi:glycosyltransferase A (GT-A) superfamily protein (DUF2064 family)